MSILQKLETEMKEAMKARDTDRLAAVRLIKSTAKNKEIELLHPLTETEFFALLSSMVKQRQESIDQFKAGGRTDLIEKEEKEIKVIQSFLPQSLSEAEVEALITKAINETGAKGPKDMGAVMKALKEPTAGRFDGRLLSEKVKTKLGSLS